MFDEVLKFFFVLYVFCGGEKDIMCLELGELVMFLLVKNYVCG